MADQPTPGLDLPEAVPRPATFAEQRLIAFVGGLALVIAAGLLILVLGTGSTPVPAGAELKAAAHAHAKDGRP